MFRSTRKSFLIALAVLCVIATASGAAFFAGPSKTGDSRTRGRDLTLADLGVDGQRALKYLKAICDLGPRPSGSEGMQQQQSLLRDHFTPLGGQVTLQSFEIRHPLDGSRVSMANMLIRWHPDRKDRVIFAAHYDTRPYPDRDRRRPKGRFIGANDGASGVAVLMELAHHLGKLDSPYGVDFILFDGEEFIFNDQDPYFLGSEFFARELAANPAGHSYRWGVLLDMVGDANLQIMQEQNSLRWPDTRPLVEDIWRVAKRLGVHEFIHRTGHEIRDDHLAMRNIAKIPTCDIIDFDYPRSGAASYWHTEQDTADKCSALSLGKVGWVMLEWFRQLDK